jgi:hypothetical protein
MFGLKIGGGKLTNKLQLRKEILQLTRDATKGVPGAEEKLKKAREQYDKLK